MIDNRWLMIFVTCFVFMTIAGQSKAQSVGKLKKLYERQKYEKLIAKSEKAILKDASNPELYYYHIAGVLIKANKTKGSISREALFEAANKFEKFSEEFDDNTFTDVLIKDFRVSKNKLLAIQRTLKKERKAYFGSFYAAYLGDTLDFYQEHLAVINKPERVNDLVSFDATSYLNSEKVYLEREGLKYTAPFTAPPGNLIPVKAEEVMTVPWVMAGVDPEKGFDCSGFICWSYGQFGYELPHKTKLLAKIGTHVTLDQAESGDIVCFGSNEYNPARVYHVGMVHSKDQNEVKMIHCGTSTGVTIAPLTTGYWADVPYFIVRIIE